MNSASIGSVSPTPQNVNSQNKETPEQLQARKGNYIDGYTEKEYNKRGWAFVNKVLYGRMGSDFNSKIASIRHGSHFERLKDGTYIIPTGEKEGINNVLVFTDGKMNDPSISQVIKIEFEHETDIAPIREQLVRYLQEGLSYEHIVEVFENYAGQKIFDIYQLGDFANYSEYRESSRSRANSDRYNQSYGNRTGSIGENSS